MRPAILPLGAQRLKIDLLDGALRRLLSVRQRVVGRIYHLKTAQGLGIRDVQREQFSAGIAKWHARKIDLNEDCALALLALSQNESRAWQESQSLLPQEHIRMSEQVGIPESLLARIPPPRRLAALIKRIPRLPIASMLSMVVSHTLQAAWESGQLDVLRGRSVAVHMTDLALTFTVVVGDSGPQLSSDAQAEASIGGTLTDLLLLSSRLEDADTLFFQRRIELSGDTELGLLVRNLMDQLEWESLPLALRILLVRAARFAERARGAHQKHFGSA